MAKTPRTGTAEPAASTDDEHPHRYNTQLANAIETRWQKHWAEQGTFTMGNPGDAGFDSTRPKL